MASELCSPRHQGEEGELGEPVLLGHCGDLHLQASISYSLLEFFPSFPTAADFACCISCQTKQGGAACRSRSNITVFY